MRLAVLTKGQSCLQRVVFSFIRALTGDTVPGPILVMSYRQKFFGKPFSRLFQSCMRGSEHWSIGEVELFAAFISKQNECHY